MIKHRYLDEWPLAAFTLAIQVGCGIAIATTIAAFAPSSAQSTVLRVLGIAVFPIVAIGLLLSLIHLGRPASAWRALSNRRSRLSLEILATAAFAISAFAYSFTWWSGATAYRFYSGTTASLLGLAAVIASAAIYQIPARPIWNSAWVVTSFLGTTVTAAGLARMAYGPSPRLGVAYLLFGNALLLISAAWMWRRVLQTVEQAKPFVKWFAGYSLLNTIALLTYFAADFVSMSWLTAAGCITVLAMVTGRLLMFALAELEPRF